VTTVMEWALHVRVGLVCWFVDSTPILEH